MNREAHNFTDFERGLSAICAAFLVVWFAGFVMGHDIGVKEGYATAVAELEGVTK